MKCQSCGSNQPDGQAFCDQCGAKLSAPLPAMAVPMSPPTAIVPPPTAVVPLAPPTAIVPGPGAMPGSMTCPACNHINPPGSNFCEECGSPVAAQQPVAYQPVATPVMPPPVAPTPAYMPTPSLVAANGSLISFKPGQSSWLIGREDPVSGIFPDVDLTANDPEQTVSRRHAQITVAGGQATLTSLTMTNWTRLNGTRLTPNQPAAIKPGDKIEFAKVTVTFQM
jgi:hypothetical protein